MSNSSDKMEPINWHNLKDEITPIQKLDLAMRLIATAPDDAVMEVLELAQDMVSMLDNRDISDFTYQQIRRQIIEDAESDKELLTHSLVNLGKLDPHE